MPILNDEMQLFQWPITVQVIDSWTFSREPYFEVTAQKRCSWRRKIIRFNIYIYPMFDFVRKKLHFSKQTVEITGLSLHRFTCRINRYSKSKSDSISKFVLCYESNGGLKISKRASIRNYVFQGKLFHLGLRETLITGYPELCFGNRAYS